jgi:PAS domain S-box-containing protein
MGGQMTKQDAVQSPEEKAHDTRELYRLLIESVQDYAIFVLDPNGYVLSWNPGAQRLKGYTSDEIIGKHFSIFYPPARVAEQFPQYELREAARVGRFEDEGWRVRKNGDLFWASVVITALRTPDGQLAGFAKVTRDLTERRAAEQRSIEDARRVAAKESARRAMEVLQSLTGDLSAANTVPEIVRVILNRGLEEAGASAGTLGLLDPSGTMIRVAGDVGFDELPELLRDARVNDDAPMSEVVRTGKAIVCRSRADRDSTFPRLAPMLGQYEAMAVLPLEGQGRVIGALAMHSEDAAALTDSVLGFLHAFVQQAGQALVRATLYEAEQRARTTADQANRAKSEFLAAMSHELRTPLNAIGGYAELIELGLRGPVTEDTREAATRIKRSQQHLLEVINDILNFSRIEAGQITYDIQPLPVQGVLDSVASMIAPMAERKGLTLHVTPAPASIVAMGDKSRVEQIMLNLVSNAIKFTPAGTVTLSCAVEESNLIAVRVSDTGLGIPADQTERVFEPFIQVGRSLTTSSEGTGLGLAISRDLARAMDGEITLESTVGRGSTFTLLLPRSND